jgi:hypothetical protein
MDVAELRFVSGGKMGSSTFCKIWAIAPRLGTHWTASTIRKVTARAIADGLRETSKLQTNETIYC